MKVPPRLPITEKVLRIHDVLAKSNVPHAFGGAIAYGYYGEPRGTKDIDLDIALPPDNYEGVVGSLSSLFTLTDEAKKQAIEQITQSGQTRVKWREPYTVTNEKGEEEGKVKETYVDLFFVNTPFHESMAKRVRIVPVDESEGAPQIPILSREDIMVCKIVFNRGQDWIDIERIFEVQGPNVDLEYVKQWLNEFYNPNEDEGRIEKIEGLARQYGGGAGPEGSPKVG